MQAVTHGPMAGAAYAAAGTYIWHQSLPVLATGTAVAIGAGVLPDLDTMGSCVARSFGLASEALAFGVARLSGGHREGTHTGVGEAVCALIAVIAISLEGTRFHVHLGTFSHQVSAGRLLLGAYLALLFSAGAMSLRLMRRHGLRREVLAITAAAVMVATNWDTGGIAWAILAGTFVHAAGDACTEHGVAWAKPLSGHVFHLLPKPLRISTGHAVERILITPAVLVALGLLAVHAVALAVPHWPAL